MWTEVVEETLEDDNFWREKQGIDKWFKLKNSNGDLSISAYLSKESADKALQRCLNKQ